MSKRSLDPALDQYAQVKRSTFFDPVRDALRQQEAAGLYSRLPDESDSLSLSSHGRHAEMRSSHGADIPHTPLVEIAQTAPRAMRDRKKCMHGRRPYECKD